MRVRLMLAMVLVAASADAAQIVLKYKPPFYLDDTILFSITTPYATDFVRQTEEPANLTIEVLGTRMVGAAQQHWFLARPAAAGPARIPPFAIPGTKGNEIAAGVSLNILPVNQSDNPDSIAILQRMRDSGRPPVVGIVTVQPQPAYVGEIVEITWEVISDNVVEVYAPEVPKIDGVVEVNRAYAAPGMTSAAGKLVQRRQLRRLVFIPDQAGTIVLPPAKIQGNADASGIREPFFRMTPKEAITVLPVPGDLPAGAYTLNVSKPSINGSNASMSIDIAGPGDPGVAHPPDLSDVHGTYLLQPRPLKVTVDPKTQQLVGTRTWSIDFHAHDRDIDIPAVRFTSWDRNLQHPVTVERYVNATVPAKGSVPKTTDESQASKVSPETANGVLIMFGVIDLLLLVAVLITNSVSSV